LSVDLVVNLLNAGVPPEKVVELIQQTPSDFNLSLQTIDNLRNGGVPLSVLDAMLRARTNQSIGGVNPPTPQPNPPSNVPPPTNIQPGVVNPAPGGGGNVGATGTSVTGGDAQRLQQAKTAPIPKSPWTQPAKQLDPGCPSTITPAKHRKLHTVDIDYDTGSSSDSRLGGTGLYCFALRNANPLYDWLITLNVSEPTGNPFDLLNDAIQTLSKLATGAAAPTKPTPNPLGPTCKVDLTEVTQKATTLKQLLAAVVPGKDSSGKVAYIPLATTRKNWQPVEGAFNSFEEAVRSLQTSLPDPSNTQGCDPTLLSQAESIILDDYPKVRTEYQDLATKLSRPDVQYYERSLEATATADLIATPSYAGTADSSRTFHFDPSFGILSSSAGFLLTRLPARAYSSATAPDSSDLTKTQNVLRVDYGAGVRPALIVLLTGNVPQVNSRNFGLGVSAGPVFDIASGKADTSHFGFFAGPSVRLTPWIFLTPGFHFGEFADFPQGFTRAGQVIPSNTGTPVPTKRFTGRFAFSITFKIKDLGAVIGSGQQSNSSSPSTGTGTGTKP
jgi:hypothetical protein